MKKRLFRCQNCLYFPLSVQKQLFLLRKNRLKCPFCKKVNIFSQQTTYFVDDQLKISLQNIREPNNIIDQDFIQNQLPNKIKKYLLIVQKSHELNSILYTNPINPQLKSNLNYDQNQILQKSQHVLFCINNSINKRTNHFNNIRKVSKFDYLLYFIDTHIHFLAQILNSNFDIQILITQNPQTQPNKINFLYSLNFCYKIYSQFRNSSLRQQNISQNNQLASFHQKVINLIKILKSKGNKNTQKQATTNIQTQINDKIKLSQPNKIIFISNVLKNNISTQLYSHLINKGKQHFNYFYFEYCQEVLSQVKNKSNDILKYKFLQIYTDLSKQDHLLARIKQNYNTKLTNLNLLNNKQDKQKVYAFCYITDLKTHQKSIQAILIDRETDVLKIKLLVEQFSSGTLTISQFNINLVKILQFMLSKQLNDKKLCIKFNRMIGIFNSNTKIKTNCQKLNKINQKKTNQQKINEIQNKIKQKQNQRIIFCYIFNYDKLMSEYFQEQDLHCLNTESLPHQLKNQLMSYQNSYAKVISPFKRKNNLHFLQTTIKQDDINIQK